MIETNPLFIQPFDFSEKRVLVTGGTGFIGGRLVEKLVLECNAQVRVLVRNFARASRVARFPVEMIHGDATNSEDIKRAVDQCDLVFHCAWEVQDSETMERRVNVEATRNVFEAALHAGVERVVHLSTVLVYGTLPDGDFDETTPRHPENAYAVANLETEKLALSFNQRFGLPVTVLQPTVVYGPFGRAWTVGVLNQLKSGKVILVNDGDGLCNAVYIDDMINAMLLAAVKEKAVGEIFLIAGEQPVTWRQFYRGYEQMLGYSSTVSMSAAEAEAYFASKRRKKSIVKEALALVRKGTIRQRLLETVEVGTLVKTARLLLPGQIKRSLRRLLSNSNGLYETQNKSEQEKPILMLHPSIIRVNASKSRARIDKAKKLLGYQPSIDFESGLQLTEKWARWANFLGN